ncbi:MAG: hypothetical protein WD077_04240 [Bacteroidia bacterium]
MIKFYQVYPGLSLFALWLLPAMLSAQEAKHHWVNLSGGWNYAQMRDEGMSPLLYKGSIFSFITGYETLTAKGIQAVMLSIAGGNAKPATSGFSRADAFTIRADADYTFMPETWSSDNRKYIVYSGGSLMNVATVRQHSLYSNNDYNYEFFSSLAAAGNLKRKLQVLKHRFDLDWQLRLPFLSFALRPAFASSAVEKYDPEEYSLTGSALRSGEFVSVNHLLRLNSQLSGTYFLNNGNALRLGYSWDYYSYSKIEINRVKAGFHSITFSTLFNL